MNKLYVLIAAIILLVIWDKTLNNKEKEVVAIQPQTTINILPVEKKKGNAIVDTNNKVPSNNCNTPSFYMAKNCDSMYSVYKEKYTLAKNYAAMFQTKPSTCTVDGLKNAKELAYDQAEEKCDYRIIDSIIDNTIGLACDHIFNQKRNFMFKNEYCNKYIK